MEPRAISHFDVLGPIAAGGMGIVYRARDRVLARDVALKLVRPERAGDADARRRFIQEARAAAVLNHPGIACVYEAGEAAVEDGQPPQLFLAEELVEGETLGARVRRGPLPIAEVRHLGIQLADALAAAHDRGIVHRDIKPSNLMVTPAGVLKILDFGIAKQATVAPDARTVDASELALETLPGMVVGTPAYMAPEQMAGGPIGPPVDIYAAGCVLHELLTGSPPFAGGDTLDVLHRSLTGAPEPLTRLRPEVPPALAAVVDRALARDPAARYSSGRELAAALRALRTPAARWRSMPSLPSGLARAAAVFLLLALLAALAWMAWGRLDSPVLAFKARDFVVVADVVNETGESVFNLALKSALETDLRQSRYVNVVDASQIQGALRFSRLKTDTALDVETGRNVCRRVGAQALLVPRIIRAGEAYQLEVALVEPSTGRTADHVRVRSRGREEVLLSSIDALTRELRGRLGESMASIARADPPFAQYTTSSLEALELVVLGSRARDAGDFRKAELYYQEALRKDPRFAAARGSLGLILIQFLGRQDEGRKMLAQALAEESTLSEREYLHLRALNKQFVSADLQGALDDYRFISELYPDLVPPYNNSGRILEGLGRPGDAAALYDRAIAADPRSPVPQWNLFFLSVRTLKDPARAERAARALITLLPDNAHAKDALAWSQVASRRFAEAEAGERDVLKLNPSHVYALPNLGHLLFRRGAWTEAVAVYRNVAAQVEQGRLETGVDHLELCLGLAQAAAGMKADARRTLRRAAERVRARARTATASSTWGDQALLAALLAAAGETAEARAIVETVARRAETADLHYGLARAWALLGDRQRAVQSLERAFAAGYEDTYFILIDPPLASIQDDAAIERLAPAVARPIASS